MSKTDIITRQAETIEQLAFLCKKITELLAQYMDVTEYENEIEDLVKEGAYGKDQY